MGRNLLHVLNELSSTRPSSYSYFCHHGLTFQSKNFCLNVCRLEKLVCVVRTAFKSCVVRKAHSYLTSILIHSTLCFVNQLLLPNMPSEVFLTWISHVRKNVNVLFKFLINSYNKLNHWHWKVPESLIHTRSNL